MPLTSTERSRLRRQRLKADAVKYEAYKTEQSKKKKEYRHSKILTPKQKEDIKEKNREAQRKCRKKAELTEWDLTQRSGYSRKQSLGKAIKKTNDALPKSPTKKVHVISALISKMSPLKRKKLIETSIPEKRQHLPILNIEAGVNRRKSRCDALSEEIIRKVKDFYLRDDISRMCPGKKETISVKTPTGRETHQKRFLVMNIGEAYATFVSENPEAAIGKTKFHELRPKYVLPSGEKDHEVCMCIYHENIDMLLLGLNTICPDLPKNAEVLAKESVCVFDHDHIACIDRNCLLCSAEKYVNAKIPEEKLDFSVKYFQWGQNDVGYTIKTQIVTDLACAREELQAQLHAFTRHVYNASKQHSELRYLKEHLLPDEIIMHIDFAENYAIKHDREIMSAHWSTESVTIYTCVAYFVGSDSTLQHQSYAVISDDLAHSKDSAKVFNEHILKHLQTIKCGIRKVHYWSDGAASQFKNRFMFANLACHEDDLKMEADWSFFETAHGKGAVDGIGGAVKNRVWRAVLQGKEVVNNAKSFFEVALKISPDSAIKIIFVSKDFVEVEMQKLKERHSICKSVPDTRSLHFIRPIGTNLVEYSLNSPFSSPQQMKQAIIFPTNLLQHVPQASQITEDLQEGQWIAILYDEHWWPGQVIEVHEKQITVKHVFKPIAENKFKYLEKPLFETIPLHSYLSVLPCDPSPDQTARFFSYDSNIALKIKSLVNKV